jgi:glycosyltransferase involved in cell wall biosynthesis
MLASSYEPLTGGAETYARLLCEGLTARGHDVVIATDGAWLPDLPARTPEPAGEVLRLRAFAERVDARDKVKWRQMQYSVLDELGTLLAGAPAFDIVHANSHETLVLGAMVAMDQGAALVASLHEQNPDLERFGIGRCLLSYQALPVDMHFAASGFYAARARRFGVPEERLRVVYHGVPESVADPERVAAVRADAGVGEHDRLVVCAGRVYTRKAQHDLARALPAVLAAAPHTRVLLAGRVSDFEYERRMWAILHEGGVADRVRLRQDLGSADMPHVYAAADLVVQPSREEGLGLAAIEAMAAGKPVVGARVVGLSEVFTDGRDGLLVPAADPPALAAAMVRLLTDPAAAARLGERAVATARKRFSRDAMVAATLAGYEAALVHARRAGRTPVAATGGT